MTRRRGRTHAEYRAERLGQPVPPGLKHGPRQLSRKHWGCECELCRPEPDWAAKPRGRGARGGLTHSEAQRALRHRKRGKPVPPGVKHGIYCYRTYGCRCDICRFELNGARTRRRNAWRETAHGRWRTEVRTNGPVEVICWPPKDAGPDWVCPCTAEERKAA